MFLRDFLIKFWDFLNKKKSDLNFFFRLIEFLKIWKKLRFFGKIIKNHQIFIYEFNNFLMIVDDFSKIWDFSEIFFEIFLIGSFSMTTDPILIFSQNKYKYFPRSVVCDRFQLSIHLFSPRPDILKIWKKQDFDIHHPIIDFFDSVITL